MGIFTKVMIVLMILIYIISYAALNSQRKVSMLFGLNYDAIIHGHQYYRILTAALSHGPLMHIGFNLSALAIFGLQLEREVGTLFYAALNMWLLIVATGLHLGYQHLLIYVLPKEYGGG